MEQWLTEQLWIPLWEEFKRKLSLHRRQHQKAVDTPTTNSIYSRKPSSDSCVSFNTAPLQVPAESVPHIDGLEKEGTVYSETASNDSCDSFSTAPSQIAAEHVTQIDGSDEQSSINSRRASSASHDSSSTAPSQVSAGHIGHIDGLEEDIIAPVKAIHSGSRVLKIHDVNIACGTQLCYLCETVLLAVTNEPHPIEAPQEAGALEIEALEEARTGCTWYQAWDDLQASAKRGCHFCRMRYNRAKKQWRLEYLETTNLRMYLGKVFSDTYEIYCEYRAHFPEPHDGVRTWTATFSLLQRPEDAPVIADIALVDDSSRSLQTLNKAARWLEECDHDTRHARCRQYQNKGFMPTRLLEVGTEEDYPIRMVLGSSIPPNSQYATLSHCWASERDMIMLQEHNEEEFQHNITWQNLPRGYKDAIELCRKLCVRYLWIDSICIRQKDEEEWKQESVLMQKVYASGYCNIVLAGGRNDTETSHAVRDGLALTPFAFSVDDAEGQAPNRTYLMIDDYIWETNIKLCRLFRRGWCIQELVLAPRKLILGREQLAWACTESVAWESYPVADNLPLDAMVRTRQYKLDILLRNHEPGGQMKYCLYGLEDEVVEDLDRYWAWTRIVSDFCRAALTYTERDRLVAMFGVAQRLAPGDKFYWGLLATNFVWQLLWNVEVRSEKYTSFPSWSWASVQHGITYYHVESTHEHQGSYKWGNPDLCSVTKFPAKSDPFMDAGRQIDDRSLELIGPLWFFTGHIVAKIKWWDSNAEQDMWSVVELGMLLRFDREAPRTWDGLVLAPMTTIIRTEGARATEASTDAPVGVFGLVLKATHREAGEYVRIGTLTAYHTTKEMWEELGKLSSFFSAPSGAYRAIGDTKHWPHQRYHYTLV